MASSLTAYTWLVHVEGFRPSRPESVSGGFSLWRFVWDNLFDFEQSRKLYGGPHGRSSVSGTVGDVVSETACT